MLKKKKPRERPISLYGLSFADAVKGLGSVKMPKRRAKKKPGRKRT